MGDDLHLALSEFHLKSYLKLTVDYNNLTYNLTYNLVREGKPMTTVKSINSMSSFCFSPPMLFVKYVHFFIIHGGSNFILTQLLKSHAMLLILLRTDIFINLL